MGKIKDLDRVAYEYLLQIQPSAWSRHAFDEELKSDTLLNNYVETLILTYLKQEINLSSLC